MAGGFDILGILGGMGGSTAPVVTPTVGTNAALSPRQRLVYNHRASLYRPVRTYAADGKPSAESYELAYMDVPCRFEIKESVDNASVIGRAEGDQFFSLDSVHFAERQEVDDNWWILNQSYSADGDPADTMFGRWWTCRGQPQVFAKSARREGGKKLIKASQEKNAPLGIED